MSLGEILIRALSDTLMGMGTVFVILLIISFIISLFKFIAPRKRPGEVEDRPKATDVIPDADEDDEIAAVIIAAIMMAKEKERAAITPDGSGDTAILEPGYVVRSIKRRR